MTGSIDTSSAKFLRLFVCQVPTVTLIEDTVCEGASRADREEVTLESCAVRVDIEHSWTLMNVFVNTSSTYIIEYAYSLIPSTNHGTLKM